MKLLAVEIIMRRPACLLLLVLASGAKAAARVRDPAMGKAHQGGRTTASEHVDADFVSRGWRVSDDGQSMF